MTPVSHRQIATRCGNSHRMGRRLLQGGVHDKDAARNYGGVTPPWWRRWIALTIERQCRLSGACLERPFITVFWVEDTAR